MLIATLPSLCSESLLEEVVSSPYIGAVRYNTGERSPFGPRKTLRIVNKLAQKYGKKLWVDLKGRQLRIVKWSAPRYGRIVLNHEVSVDGPALVYFRGEAKPSELKFTRGNVIYVDPPPRHAVGEGQSVNIVGENVRISGYLTKKDIAYIKCARRLGIFNFNASFFEQQLDIAEIFLEIQKDTGVRLALKIETLKGVECVRAMNKKELEGCTLLVGRDDLFTQLGSDKMKMFEALQMIIDRDPDAIVGSKIFSGLESSKGEVSLADLSDLLLLHKMGYKNFLLSDEICQRHFHKAIESWKMFQEFISK